MSRIHRPGAIVFVTVSVLGRRCSLLPNRAFNARAGALLAIAQDRYGMGIIEYCFMSNHIHLQLKINHVTQLACFMRDLNSGLARVAKAVHGGGVGIFWSGRYHSVELGTEWEVADKGRYIRAHGVKERLVTNPLHWPGITSLKQRAAPIAHTPSGWRLCRGCRRKKAHADGCRKCKHVQVVLSARPQDEGLDARSRRAAADSEARSIQAEYAVATARGVLGLDQILVQDPWEAPSVGELAHSDKGSCRFATYDPDPVLRATVREALLEFRAVTEVARKNAVLALLSDGLTEVSFPPGAVVPQIISQTRRLGIAAALLTASPNPNFSPESATQLVERCRSLRDHPPP